MIVLPAVTLLCKATQAAVNGHKLCRKLQAATTEWEELQCRVEEVKYLLSQLSDVCIALKDDSQLAWLEKAEKRTERLLTDIARFLDNTGNTDGHNLGPLHKLKWVLNRGQSREFLVKLDRLESRIIIRLLSVIAL